MKGQGVPGSCRVAICREAWADPSVPLPAYQTAGAAGADVCANFAAGQRDGIVIAPGGRALVPLGFRMALPEGVEAQLRGRSGLALRQGIWLPNAPGTIDADYRGPVGVILANAGEAPFAVRHGDRIAQMVIAPVLRAGFEVVAELDETLRGAGGFGSTGGRG